MKLSETEKQAIKNGKSVRFQDDDIDCVVLRADMYEKWKAALEEEHDPEAMYPLLAELSPEDWEDYEQSVAEIRSAIPDIESGRGRSIEEVDADIRKKLRFARKETRSSPSNLRPAAEQQLEDAAIGSINFAPHP